MSVWEVLRNEVFLNVFRNFVLSLKITLLTMKKRLLIVCLSFFCLAVARAQSLNTLDDSLQLAKTNDWKFSTGFLGDSVISFRPVERFPGDKQMVGLTQRARDSVFHVWYTANQRDFYGMRFSVFSDSTFHFSNQVSCGTGVTSYAINPFAFTSAPFEIWIDETPWEEASRKKRMTYVISELSANRMVWTRIPSKQVE